MNLVESTELKAVLPATFKLPGRLGKKLMALNLEAIKYKLIKEKGWSLAAVDATEPHYKAYMFLLATRPEVNWVPSLAVDEMWHAHILDTQKYMADCAQLFGRYIHHYPYLGLKDEEDAAQTAALYQRTKAEALAGFGLSLEPQMDLADCGGGGGCGGGGSSCGSSCSSGSSSDAPSPAPSPAASCTTYIPVASCGSSGGSESPRRPFRDKAEKPKSAPTPAPQPPGSKRPWWKPSWMNSVNPDEFGRQYRPSRADVVQMQLGEVQGNA